LRERVCIIGPFENGLRLRDICGKADAEIGLPAFSKRRKIDVEVSNADVSKDPEKSDSVPRPQASREQGT
jgi:hypothetical protein